jgi:hypothetical protein
MWTVFAPIVRWPLRSPWRLTAVLAVVLVSVFVLGELNGDDKAPAADPGPAVTETTGPEGGDTTRATEPDGWPSATPLPRWSQDEDAVPDRGNNDAYADPDPGATNPAVAAAQASAEFVSAWARPDLAVETWRAGLEPLVTDRLYERLQDTDPANIPAVTVAGEPVDVAMNAEAGVFDVPTTGAHVRVFVELDANAGNWLVNDVQPTN